jgi:hypothetical protein
MRATIMAESSADPLHRSEQYGEGLPAPALERIADGYVQVAPAIDVGETPEGRRRLVPILGGTFRGRLAGRVLPGGTDFQLVKSPSLVVLHARYVLETEQNELVYVENDAIRVASPELLARLNRGEQVDPAHIYCRTRPRFETASKSLAWLMESTFVGSATRAPDCVQLAFFRVL